MRNATAVDIVRRLTGSLYKMTAATPNALGDGMGVAQLRITDAVDEAIAAGFVTVKDVRDPTYGNGVRFIALTDGISYCQTCIDGCNHGGDQGSCEHGGCWGPDATNDCTGITVARYVDIHHASLYVTD